MNFAQDPGLSKAQDVNVSQRDTDFYEPRSVQDKANLAGKVLQIISVLVLASGIFGALSVYNFTADNQYDSEHPFAGFAIGLGMITVALGFLLFAVGAYIEAKTDNENGERAYNA